MSITMEHVLAFLQAEEPDYDQAFITLGIEAIPHLERLIRGSDLGLSTKAIHLISFFQGERTLAVLSHALRSDERLIRVAVAGAARNLQQPAVNSILLPLVDDGDVGVRKVALKSVQPDLNPELRSKIESLSKTDSSPIIRSLSNILLNRE